MTRLLKQFVHILHNVLRIKLKNLSFIKHTSYAFLIILCGTGLGMLLRIALAHEVQTEQYGYYAYGLTWLVALVQFATLGLQTATIRIIPRYSASGNWNSIKGFIYTSYCAVLFAAAALSCVVVGFIVIKNGELKSDFIYVFLLVAMLIPIESFLQLVSRQVLAFRNVFEALFPISVLRTIVQIGVIATIYFVLKIKLDAVAIMFAYMIGTIVATLKTGLFLKDLTAAEIKKVQISRDLNEWISITTPQYGQNILQIVSSQFDLLALGIYVGIRDVGIYSILILVATAMNFGLGAVNQIVAPRFSYAFALGDMIELQQLVKRSTAISTIYALVIFVAVLVGGQWFLSILGEDYTIGYTPLLILAMGQVVNSGAGSVGLLMNMTNLEKAQLAFLFTSSLIGLIASLVLVPRLGILGAAIANTSALVFLELSSVWYVWHRLKIKATLIQFLF